MTARARQTVVEIISILFIMLFVYAAVSKWMGFNKFSAQLSQSPIISPFTSWIVWTIPVTELLISAMLGISKWRLTGLYISFFLMIMFSAYIFTITHYSEFIPCSCGGVLEHMSWNTHLIFNLCFGVLAAMAVIIHPIHRQMKSSS